MKQGTQEWHDARAGKLTATRIGKVMNGGQMRAEVLREMVREALGLDREFKGNAATEYGTAHEAQARFEYESHTGSVVHETGYITHPEIPWLGASPDGVDESGRALVEIKCPYKYRDQAPPPNAAKLGPNHLYSHQMQCQMHCTGADKMDHFAWSAHGFRLETYARDDDWIRRAVEAGEVFLAELRAILADPEKAQEIAGEPVERTDPDWVALANEYTDLSRRIKEIESQADQYRADLKAVKDGLVALSGGEKAIGAGVQVIPTKRKGGLDEKRLSEVVNLEQYRKPETVTMTVRERKDKN